MLGPRAGKLDLGHSDSKGIHQAISPESSLPFPQTRSHFIQNKFIQSNYQITKNTMTFFAFHYGMLPLFAKIMQNFILMWCNGVVVIATARLHST